MGRPPKQIPIEEAVDDGVAALHAVVKDLRGIIRRGPDEQSVKLLISVTDQLSIIEQRRACPEGS